MKPSKKLYSAYRMVLKNGYQVNDIHVIISQVAPYGFLVKTSKHEILKALNIKDFEIELKSKNGLQLPKHKARVNHLYKMGFFIDDNKNKKKIVHMNLDSEIVVIRD